MFIILTIDHISYEIKGVANKIGGLDYETYYQDKDTYTKYTRENVDKKKLRKQHE